MAEIEIWNQNIVNDAGPTVPRGSKYPIFEVSDPKNHALNGIWDQSP